MVTPICLHAVTASLWERWMSPEGLTGFGTVFLAISVAVAIISMKGYERIKRVERAMELIREYMDHELGPAETDDKRRLFPNRYKYVKPNGFTVKTPLTEGEAEQFWRAANRSVAPSGDERVEDVVDRFWKPTAPAGVAFTDEDVERYELARRHLNHLEIVAFAYVYKVADRKVLAAEMFPILARSYSYFEKLIERFEQGIGTFHGWTLIRQAVKDIVKEYGEEGEKLYAKGKAK